MREIHERIRNWANKELNRKGIHRAEALIRRKEAIDWRKEYWNNNPETLNIWLEQHASWVRNKAYVRKEQKTGDLSGNWEFVGGD